MEKFILAHLLYIAFREFEINCVPDLFWYILVAE